MATPKKMTDKRMEVVAALREAERIIEEKIDIKKSNSKTQKKEKDK